MVDSIVATSDRRLGEDDSDERTSLPKVQTLKFYSTGRGKKVIGDKEATHYFFQQL